MLNRGERFVARHSRMMKETTTPEGWHTVTPRIVAQNAERLVSFLRQVFDATGDYQTDRPSIIMIGDSRIMISEAGIRKPVPAFLYVYVSDCDAMYQRALKSGAGSLGGTSGHSVWRPPLYGRRRMGQRLANRQSW